jgi:hypothetical protein
VGEASQLADGGGLSTNYSNPWLKVLTVSKVAAQLRFLHHTESILGAGVA